MRKTGSLSVGLALTATVAAAVPTMADSTVVARGGVCAMPGFGSGGELVAPQRADGAMQYGKTHQVSGFTCAVIFPDGSWDLTDDSFVKITKSGDTTMRCKLALEELED